MIQEITITPTQLQVALSGCIHVADTVTIRENLSGYIDKGHTEIVIDLSGVEYIDAAGLGMLVYLHKKTLGRGGHLTLTGVQGFVKTLFELTQLHKNLTVNEPRVKQNKSG